MGIIDKMKKKSVDEQTAEVAEKKVAPAKKTASSTKKGNAPRSTTTRVLIRPMLSEKTTHQEAQGQYTFVVTADATKPAIKRAVKEVYGVEPQRVNIINVEGKTQRFGRFTGRRRDWKKAIVSLPKGKTIHIHEGV